MKTAYLTILLAALTVSEARAESGILLGGQAGRASLDASFDGFDMDSTESAGRFYAGWQVNDHFGVMGGYQTFGDFEQTVGSDTVKVHADGFTLSLLGSLPVSERFTLVGELGGFFWDGNASINNVTQATPSDTNLLYGIGVRYALTETFRLAGDWRNFDLDDATVSVVGIGVEFTF